jgi:hypothetical protein
VSTVIKNVTEKQEIFESLNPRDRFVGARGWCINEPNAIEAKPNTEPLPFRPAIYFITTSQFTCGARRSQCHEAEQVLALSDGHPKGKVDTPLKESSRSAHPAEVGTSKEERLVQRFRSTARKHSAKNFHNLHNLLNIFFFCSLRAMEVLGLCRRILHHIHHVHRGKLMNSGDGGLIEPQPIASLR